MCARTNHEIYGPGHSAEMCWGFCCMNFGGFAGDFHGGFFWSLSPHKNEEKNSATKSAKKNRAAKKWKSAKNTFYQEPDPLKFVPALLFRFSSVLVESFLVVTHLVCERTTMGETSWQFLNGSYLTCLAQFAREIRKLRWSFALQLFRHARFCTMVHENSYVNNLQRNN